MQKSKHKRRLDSLWKEAETNLMDDVNMKEKVKKNVRDLRYDSVESMES